MKKVLLLSLFLSLIFVVQNARSQGLENFNNYPETSNAYHNGTFTGQDGSTWSYNQCRGDSAINAPTPTMGKNRTPTGEVFSGTIHGGCGTLNFDYKQVFSTSVSLDVYVNGILLTTVTTTNEQGIIKNSGTINVNTAGDFVFDFKQNSTAAGQCAIDNISWTGNSTVLPEPTNYPTNFTATPGYFKIILTWTDATGGQAPTSYLVRGSSSNNIVAPVDGTPVADDPNLVDGSAALNILQGVHTCMFTGLLSSTPYYFAIYPYTNSGGLIDYKTDGTAPAANATTPNGVIIFHRDFNDRLLSPMIAKNIQGPNQFWLIDTIHGTSSSGCATMSGYLGGVYFVNEDWLITPAMNFDLYTNEVLNFMSSYNYTGNSLSVKISNTYDGSGDPNSFTWTDLTPILSPGGWIWTNSGDLDVSGVNGTGVYIAFKYTSTATASSTWELDDILVLGTPVVGIGEKTNSTDFTISPNPSQGMVKLAFNGKGNKEINIMNVTGNKVFQETTDLMIRNIDLTNLSSGIYFVQVTDVSTSKISVKKLIIR
ncbi:MAG: T9SS C-terminal target domain-containing protein [Bacteroidetes bacterium]|nr:MAG: T9SS C-terminal target domain-containing protein [Bacteroidota bacterium]